EDIESRRPFLEGFVVREYCEVASNWRSEKRLGEYLSDYKIVSITGIDTRKLVRHLRDRGAMRAIISTEGTDAGILLERVRSSPTMIGRALAAEVSCRAPFEWSGGIKEDRDSFPHVVAYDFGIKFNILRLLASRGFRVTVVPSETTADEVIGLSPDG